MDKGLSAQRQSIYSLSVLMNDMGQMETPCIQFSLDAYRNVNLFSNSIEKEWAKLRHPKLLLREYNDDAMITTIRFLPFCKIMHKCRDVHYNL